MPAFYFSEVDTLNASLLRQPLLLFLCPGFQLVANAFLLGGHLRLRRQLRAQLQSHAVRVEEIDRFEDAMISDAQHFDAVGFQTRLHLFELCHRIYAEGHMVDPCWRIRRWCRHDIVPEIEESDARTIRHTEK